MELRKCRKIFFFTNIVPNFVVLKKISISCIFSDTLVCRICCTQSKSFCRLLAQHQNIQWAFKNIAPYSTQYASAVDELMKLMQLFVAKV
jgi:hypothetical protein